GYPRWHPQPCDRTCSCEVSVMITDSAADALNLLIAENGKYRTTSKGLARSLVWRDGVPPPEMGPNFGENLTAYLLLQADRSLIASLRLVESENRERVVL